MSNLSYLEIWKRLSNVGLGEFIEIKNGFDFVAWSRIWAELMNQYPMATFEFSEVIYFKDDSAEVRCRVRIGDCEREAFLAVTNFKNQAIKNPGAVDIQNSKQRCLVKACGLFGLGFSLWLGEAVETTLVGSDDLLDKIATVVERDFAEIFLSWKEFRRFVKEYKKAPLNELPYEDSEKLLKWLKSKGAKDVSSWPTSILVAYNAARLEGS